MTFETEYQLEEFRKIQGDLFDENGKRFSATRISDNEAEQMLEVINILEKEIKYLESIKRENLEN